MSRARVIGLLIAFLAIFVLAAPLALRRLLWQWEQNPLLRGRLLAAEAGCVNCHRPYRGTEIPNPGSRWGSVPRFEAGNAMMYVESRDEIEQLIRHGAPDAWRSDPQVVERLAEQRITMPAYEGRLSEAEIAALTAWASAVEGVDVPGGETAAAGRQLARQRGCQSCHGLEGAGGLANPGSLGGFVPGFLGRNFDDLVESREEFEEWVRTGTLERLESNPLIRRAWRRQALSMPAYGDSLTSEEMDQLWGWVQAVREAWD